MRKPDWQSDDGRIQLHCCDCLALLPELEAGSVDAVIADLPYGTTACKWDVVIPFEPLWAGYQSIIKDRGAVVLSACQPFTTDLINSNREWFKYCLVWEKNRPTDKFNAKNRPMRKHEDLIVFSSGTTANLSPRRMPYFPQGLIDSGKVIRGTTGKWSSTKRRSHRKEYVLEKTSYPTSILKFPKDEHGHNTAKPVALIEYLTRTYTVAGELVLDNTMGSGTTAIACIRTNRRFIGIELERKYFDIGVERCIQELARHPLLEAV